MVQGNLLNYLECRFIINLVRIDIKINKNHKLKHLSPKITVLQVIHVVPYDANECRQWLSQK